MLLGSRPSKFLREVKLTRFVFTSLAYSRKSSNHSSEAQILSESEVLATLAKHSVVRVELSPCLPKRLLESIVSPSTNTSVISSSLLKSIIRKGDISVKLVGEDGGLPTVQIDSAAVVTASSAKSKQLKLRTNIDDHMLSVKVRQASELVAKGHAVAVLVSLPSRQLRQLSESEALSEQEKTSMKKKLYESNVQRFKEAFKSVGDGPIKLVQSGDFKDFTLLIRGRNVS